MAVIQPDNSVPKPRQPLTRQALFDKCVVHLKRQGLPATTTSFSESGDGVTRPATFQEGRSSPLTFLLSMQDMRALRKQFSWELLRDLNPEIGPLALATGMDTGDTSLTQLELFQALFNILEYRGVGPSERLFLLELEDQVRTWTQYWIDHGANPATPCHLWLGYLLREFALKWRLDQTVCNFTQP